MSDPRRKLQRLQDVAAAFTPGTPISSVELFAGRQDQILTLLSVLGQPGQHAALYGERGVGKTSLANIVAATVAARGAGQRLFPVRINCTTGDTYASLWRGVLRRLGEAIDEHEVSSDRVLELLEKRTERALIIIDELDRFDDPDGLSLIADTIKALSDQAVRATIVLVGVGDSIAQLIGDHRSIERALVQVKMPRMTLGESRDIIDRGLASVEMSIEAEARMRIARLSEGLPSYTHLLSLHAAEHAVQDDRDRIVSSDVDYATSKAVQKAQHSILTDYNKAVRSPRSDSLFTPVLLACALAEKDEVGSFGAKSIRGPLSRILGRSVPISAFVRHLLEFTSEDHGSILLKEGQPRRFTYRFTNPMLPTYVTLRGLAEQRITESMLLELRPDQEEDLFSSL